MLTCVDCDSHWLYKVNYFIHRPHTRTTRQRIEELLKYVEHGVIHTTFVLEIDRIDSEWHIARLSPNLAKWCWEMHVIIRTGKHVTPTPIYKRLKKEFRFTNNMEYEFQFCHDDIKRGVSASMKKYVLDWPILSNTWLVKILGTNLSREEVLAFEDAGFQPQ